MNKNFIKYLLSLCLLVISFNQVKCDTTPVLIGLNYSDLLAVKDDIVNGKTETVAAYNRIISIANGILKKTPLKVTDGVGPVSGNVHDFYTISSYAWPNPNTEDGMPWIYKDGYINEEAEKDDYDLKRYNTTIYYIKTLSLAWFYSGDELYANKAAELLRVWFINEESYDSCIGIHKCNSRCYKRTLFRHYLRSALIDVSILLISALSAVGRHR
jgi:hypothetical protein